MSLSQSQSSGAVLYLVAGKAGPPHRHIAELDGYMHTRKIQKIQKVSRNFAYDIGTTTEYTTITRLLGERPATYFERKSKYT